MNVCKYGCGREGIFECKSFYAKGTFRCASSPNSCPALKKKNRDAQPYFDHRKDEVINKIKNTIKTNLGEDYLKVIGERSKNGRLKNNPNAYTDMHKAMRATCLEKYGVDSVSKRKETQEKVKQTLYRRYGVEHMSQIAEVKRARRAVIMEENVKLINTIYQGLIFDGSDKDKKLYSRLIRKITNTTVKLEGFKRPGSSDNFHLDHKYSVAAGYLNKIPPEIISSKHNLEYITAEENLAKKEKCSISINTLIEHYENDPINWIIAPLRIVSGRKTGSTVEPKSQNR